MNAFENAKKFFYACEDLEGWVGCKQYVVDDAPFAAQSEPLVDVKTVEAYCDWMAGFGKTIALEQLMIFTPRVMMRKPERLCSLQHFMQSTLAKVAQYRRLRKKPIQTMSIY